MSEYMPDDLQSNQAGQPGANGSGGPAEQAPTYVTQADLDATIKRIEESVSRLVQSQTDRTVGGLRKSVEKRLAAFQELATEAGMPQQLIEAEKARIWSEAIDEYQTERKQQPAAQQDDVAQVNQWILEIADELNVAPVYPKDPEFSQINWQADPATFRQQYDSAIRAKAARRHGQPAPQPEPTQQPSAPGARAPMMNQGPPSGNLTLEQMTQRLRALQVKTNRTRADWEEMQGLEAKIVAQLPRR